MLRALQIGLKLSDLNEITIGEIMDVLVESSNDQYEYPMMPTKADFERF